MSNAADRVSLVIGVTGHRDLVPTEIPAITMQVERFFDILAAQFPDLPMMVLTPLAEGADRLVGDVARARGYDVVNLLPMPAPIYELDFEGESLDEFAAHKEAGEVIELPLVDGTAVEDLAQPGLARDLQYAQLGVYLAAHSHILLAIWDGKPSQATGGTAQVVEFHQRDVVELLAEQQQRSHLDFADDESDLVFHIVTSRIETGGPENGLAAGQATWLSRDDQQPRTVDLPARYRLVFERMAEFNRDLASVSGDHGDDLMPLAEVATENPSSQPIARLYGIADELAVRYQRYFIRSTVAIYLAVVLAIMSFILYADLEDQDVMIFGYLAFVLIGSGIFLLMGRRQWERKFLDYRVLAEGLRVQFYWALAGVDMVNPSRFSHDSFLQGRDLELGWIRNIMRYSGFRTDSESKGGDPPIRLDLVRRYWIGDDQEGQLGYYDVAAERKLRRLIVTSGVVKACFVAGIFVVLVLAFFKDSLGATLSNYMIALMGLLPAVSGLRANYTSRMGEQELVAQYAHMSRILGNAKRLLDNAESDSESQEILRELGEAALDENAQWILRQRERPMPGGEIMQG
jgi:hypothetical protein